jgi:hypothetical protein
LKHEKDNNHSVRVLIFLFLIFYSCRMQAMEAKGQELIKKKNSLTNDKKLLLDFLRSIPLHIHVPEDQDINPDALAEGWRQYTSHQGEYVNNLESKLAIAEYSISQLEAKHRQDVLMLQSASTASTVSSSDVNSESESPDSSSHLHSEIRQLSDEKKVSPPKSFTSFHFGQTYSVYF